MLLALMVMPRSRSRSIESKTCAVISRWDSAPVSSSNRSARVDLPWSMCAMMQKLRMSCGSIFSFGQTISFRGFRLRQAYCAKPAVLSELRVCHRFLCAASETRLCGGWATLLTSHRGQGLLTEEDGDSSRGGLGFVFQDGVCHDDVVFAVAIEVGDGEAGPA